MKLKAAFRLMAATEPSVLQTIIDLLADHDIKAEFPDDVGNSIVGFSNYEPILDILVGESWVVVGFYALYGGLYTGGECMTLKYKDETIKMFASVPDKVSIWIEPLTDQS